MSYTTYDALIQRYGLTEISQLTDRDCGTSVEPSILAQAIAGTDALINGRLRTAVANGYLVEADLANAENDALLRELALPIARAKLYIHGYPEGIKLDFDLALEELGRIAAGATRLMLGDVIEGAIMTSNYDAPDRVFTDDSLAGY